MKNKGNKSNQRDQQQNISNEQQSAVNRETPASSGTVHTQPGAVNAREKKPISHRTGDATNFGDRSYRED